MLFVTKEFAKERKLHVAFVKNQVKRCLLQELLLDLALYLLHSLQPIKPTFFARGKNTILRGNSQKEVFDV